MLLELEEELLLDDKLLELEEDELELDDLELDEDELELDLEDDELLLLEEELELRDDDDELLPPVILPHPSQISKLSILEWTVVVDAEARLITKSLTCAIRVLFVANECPAVFPSHSH